MKKMLAKTKTFFCCRECGYSTQKWLGKCPDCGEWNSLVEEKSIQPSRSAQNNLTQFTSTVSLLSEIEPSKLNRAPTGMGEFDRILGGGVTPGSLILLGGAPGIGKSTLVLQIAGLLGQKKKVLYVSGEESQEQIKSRADRLGVHAPNLYLLSETSLEVILDQVKEIKPEFLIVDSIQTTARIDFPSSAGSVAQIRECAAEFLACAKSQGITVFLLGHVTKEGDLAGPRVLEHIVDTVLYFESEPQKSLRVLRAHKNRFGPTSEVALFEMESDGLKEVADFSEVFLKERHKGPGSCLVMAMEGSRPLVLEIQALVSQSYFGLPRRMVNSMDFNRALLMIAVLEKRVNLNLGTQDVFVNVTGGVRVKEPAADLGLACAIASAFGNFYPSSDGVFIGEVGLGGELRSVSHSTERLKESERLGFSWAVVPRKSLKNGAPSRLKIIAVDHLKEAIQWLQTESKSSSQIFEKEESLS